MTIQDLGSIGEFVAALATLATLVYLALQIRQNTRIVRSTAFQQVVDSFSQFSLAVGLNRDVSELFSRARQVSFSSLDPADQAQMRFLLRSYFRRAESVYFQSQQGTLEMESWEGIRESLKGMLRGGAVRDYWEENCETFNSRFRAFVESELLPPA